MKNAIAKISLSRALKPFSRPTLTHKPKSVLICEICEPFSYLTQTSQKRTDIYSKLTFFREFRAFCVPHISLTSN